MCIDIPTPDEAVVTSMLIEFSRVLLGLEGQPPSDWLFPKQNLEIPEHIRRLRALLDGPLLFSDPLSVRFLWLGGASFLPI